MHGPLKAQVLLMPLPNTVPSRSAGLRHVRATTRRIGLAALVSAVVLGAGYAHALPHLPRLGVERTDPGDAPGSPVAPPGPASGTGHTVTGAS